MTDKTKPDVAKVFAAIAAIISRREGRKVRLVSVQTVSGSKEPRKIAG